MWGSTGRTSSDGQFFPSGRNADEINAKYGLDPGLKIYSFLSARYGSFHSNVIRATAGEAPFVLDGPVCNAAEFDPLVRHVDTCGVSEGGGFGPSPGPASSGMKHGFGAGRPENGRNTGPDPGFRRGGPPEARTATG